VPKRPDIEKPLEAALHVWLVEEGHVRRGPGQLAKALLA
jgi:hypothetical protein